MNEKAIQLFCGIKSDSNHYKENKNSLCIYSLFALFFGVIISLINYYETKNKDIFIYPALFVLVDIFFFLWLKKNKNASTHENYFLFQGFISMAMSLIWMFVAVSNTISKGLGFSYFALLGIVIGVINYDDCTIHVQRQLGRDFSRDEEVAEPKTITKNEIHLKTFSSERILPIPDMIFDAVMKERKKYEARRSRRKKSFQDKGYICCSSYGRPRSPSFVYAPFKQALKECGLPDIRFHDLRHSYATMLLKHDFDVKAVSVLLGHANTIITVDTYGDKKKIIEDCVDDILPFIDYVLSDYCIPSNEQKFVGDHSDVEISLDFINELFPGEDYNNEENESETVTFSVDELYSSN